MGVVEASESVSHGTEADPLSGGESVIEMADNGRPAVKRRISTLEDIGKIMGHAEDAKPTFMSSLCSCFNSLGHTRGHTKRGMFPPIKDPSTGRRRGYIERTHMLFADPGESRLGVVIMTVVIIAIIVSCTSFVLETLPGSKVYTDECQRCKPVDPNDFGCLDSGFCALSDEFQAATDLRHSEAVGQVCRDRKCEPKPNWTFNAIELVAVIIFSAEYGLRILTCPSVKSHYEQSQHKLRDDDEDFRYTCCRHARRVGVFIIDPMNLIDLLAILPWYIEAIAGDWGGPGLTFIRILRLLRVVRLGKALKLSTSIVEYSDAVLIFLKVFEMSAQALSIGLLYTFILMVLLGAIIFVVEQGAWNPYTGEYTRGSLYYLAADNPSPFTSIPASFWWVLVTFTTVGYGDMSPSTDWGRALGVLVMYAGIIFLAMPITIIGSNFQILYDEQKEKVKKDKADWLKAAHVLITSLFSEDTSGLSAGWDHWVSFVQNIRAEEHDVGRALRQELSALLEGGAHKDTLSQAAGNARLETQVAALTQQVEAMSAQMQTMATLLTKAVGKRDSTHAGDA